MSDHNELLIAFDNHKSDNFLSIESTQQSTRINYRTYNVELENFLESPINSFSDLILGLSNCKNNNLEHLTITRKNNPKKPWVNDELLSLIDERERYYKLLKKSPNNDYLIQKYESLSNLVKQKKIFREDRV